RSSYPLLSANEAVLQAVMELLLPNNMIPELCLLMKISNQKEMGYPKFIRLVLARKLKSRKMDEKD
ncbi:7393_t:CDS:2, partial [Dentiscutata erythropus]